MSDGDTHGFESEGTGSGSINCSSPASVIGPNVLPHTACEVNPTRDAASVSGAMYNGRFSHH